ncbi:MAG: flagellar biosynthesis protein FlhB [Desulfobacterales bacterium]|nr:flagellar biosynthesis protein FlhB [Desulfobacterales bacterium]MDD3949892.1 flagellar biosynthesis protein FlhB [Desulfobacterales bacterium]MDD4463792.1 flagellar biosynthesis protein FlhB [Desulfobacterales bacterium]
MAENDKDQERTEQATPKRREESREKGQVAKSREVSSAAILAACLIYFHFNASGMMNQIQEVIRWIFMESAQQDFNVQAMHRLMTGLAFKTMILMIPLFLTVLAIGVLSNVIQVGILFSAEPILPKLSKIDPIQGFQRLFSLKSLVELFKNILKMSIVGIVAYQTVKKEIIVLPTLMDQSVSGILIYIGRISYRIMGLACIVLIVLAILDYAYQRWEHEKSLRMSKKDIRDEYKHTEGDPVIKGRIKRQQREMARKRMMANVPRADVVITNPTHLAVALRYDSEKMIAPVVIAKGAGFIAEKIKEISKVHSIPVIENKPLAQVLYKIVDVDQMVPENLYKAVAEILAYVYGLKPEKRMK